MKFDIKTSYYAVYRESNGVGISGRVPPGFKGERIIELSPPWKLYKKLNYISQEKWVERFHKLVLKNLDPLEVAKGCDGKVLLCYEKAGDFCHRRIVAEWLETELGIIVPEWSKED